MILYNLSLNLIKQAKLITIYKSTNILLCRSEIIQHRNGDKESNNYRRRDALRRTRKCIQGEECTTMAVYNLII
jgi:hypothetical protein